jgi:hypothetical protein
MIAIVNLAIVDYCHYRISKMALLCFHSIFTSFETVKKLIMCIAFISKYTHQIPSSHPRYAEKFLQSVSLRSTVYLPRNGCCHCSKFISNCIKMCCYGSFIAHYYCECCPFSEVYLKYRACRQCFYTLLYNYYDYNYFFLFFLTLQYAGHGIDSCRLHCH